MDGMQDTSKSNEAHYILTRMELTIFRASYAADWGDYVSFAEHMRHKADSIGADMLLIDTGDRIEGNGLYDSSNPLGKYTFDIIKEQNIDVLCSGNHELYKKSSAENEYRINV